jgi:thiol-disulfide isomerase/thioredoxin
MTPNFNSNKLKTTTISLLVILGLGLVAYYLLNAKAASNSNESTQAIFAASLPNENGQIEALKKYAGKIVVLNFWATWCEPCREEMPELSTLNDAYKNKNLVVLGIAIDEAAAVSKFLKETKVSYPIYAADMQGMDYATKLGNDKDVLPYTVIINTDGSVVKTYFGRVTKPLLEETLSKLIQK